MRIGIDVSQIVYGTGVSVYTRRLVEGLKAIDENNEYVLFGGSLRRMEEIRQFGARAFPIAPTLADWLWNRLHVLPVERLVGNLDVVHTSDWAEPPSRCPKVTTIHDMSPLLFPNKTPSRIVDVHRRKFEWVKRETSCVIVPSKQTKEDVVSSGVHQEKVVVIAEAASERFYKRDEKDVARVRKKYEITRDYLLSVGATRRKNADGIMAAFKKLGLGDKYELLFTGIADDDYRADGVRMLGYVDEGDMPALYSGAIVFVYPSFYEGFGLPVLEAMACGAAVVTSEKSSMSEVAGGAAVLVSPASVDSIADGIKKAMKSGEKLVKKGLARVKLFSWKKTARETLKVYEKVAEGGLV